MSASPTSRKRREEDESGLTIADLMSGLMVLFLFIAVVFLNPLLEAREEAEATAKRVETEQARVRQIVVAFREAEDALLDALEEEFRHDWRRWNAELDRPILTIRFRAPDVLFAAGAAELSPEFRRILADFLPRYTAILWRYRDHIEEVRIEGHTSSEWAGATSATEAFFRNMALSQERTRSVLDFWLRQALEPDRREWLTRTVTANGLSSSRLWRRADGAEDRDRSRRVEFRIATRARERVLTVLEEMERAEAGR
ncbi:OmpA/MotB family protein [Elioraea thermophila]|uniref:OmpA/MotB family protein n=1 Tax=Elioraea thermophila TaxID=2185104 RepID=UPI000DF1F935|nr:OmpA family protein [Elioraea thermophila]